MTISERASAKLRTIDGLFFEGDTRVQKGVMSLKVDGEWLAIAFLDADFKLVTVVQDECRYLRRFRNRIQALEAWPDGRAVLIRDASQKGLIDFEPEDHSETVAFWFKRFKQNFDHAAIDKRGNKPVSSLLIDWFTSASLMVTADHLSMCWALYYLCDYEEPRSFIFRHPWAQYICRSVEAQDEGLYLDFGF